MAKRTLEYLKSKFETGDKPTGEDFVDLIDSLDDLGSLTLINNNLQQQITRLAASGGFDITRTVLRDPTSGVCDGVNQTFILSKPCVPNTEQVMHNGKELYPGDDYTIAADYMTIKLTFIPAATDRVSVNFYAAAPVV